MENELRLSILLIVASFLISICAYGLLPNQIITQLNLSKTNDYLPKLFGMFLFPVLIAVLYLLFLLIPNLDPLKKNVMAFKIYYYRFIFAMTAFFFLIYLQIILRNLGFIISFNLTLPVLLAGLFICIGFLLEKTKRNWFIGIRTPWTLSSDEVWDQTHKFGGICFKVAGLMMLVSLILQAQLVLIILTIAISLVLTLICYSYFIYRNLNLNGK